MANYDVYGRTGELDKPVLDAITVRLEARRKDKRYMSMLREYLDLIPLAEKKNVLVLGCGTGVEIRELFQREDFNGVVTAVDISNHLVEFGKSCFSEERIGDKTQWLVADAAATGLPADCFDLVISHTLISHVQDPNAVLAEIARVLKPEGTVAIFDGDYATMTFGTEDPEYGKQMDEIIIQSIVANPRVMRSLPRMLVQAGLQLEESKGWVLTEIGTAEFFAGSLDSFSMLLPKAGLVSQSEVDTFVADQRDASENGKFFGGYNFYAMIAKMANAP